ncbi:hypothetical protein TB2_032483 [Malus domestica]
MYKMEPVYSPNYMQVLIHPLQACFLDS